MENHISSVCSSAHVHLYNIGKIRQYLTKSSLEQLIHALITSKLDYCNSLLYGISKKQLSRLQRVQNSAARLITLTKKREHITPVLHQLHWLPIKQRIKFKILLLIFKCINGLAPSYLTELITPYHPTRDLRSASYNLLSVPYSNSSYHENAFATSGPILWNDLPHHLRTITCLTTFKNKLKTHLFIEHFHSD